MMAYLIKPLAEKMLAHLRNGRAIELSGKVRLTDDFKETLAGLYRRGFINTQKTVYGGKELAGVYITAAGTSFLEKYDDNAKNMQSVKR